MSDVAMSPAVAAKGEPAFRGATVALIITVGVLAFVGMLVLGAYAPDLRSGRNGGAHALSNAATGYSGIIQLAEATGRRPAIVRNVRMLGSEDLVVLTPERGATDLTKALAQRGGKATLVVLPKWQTTADPKRRGWVFSNGLTPKFEPEGVLAPATKLKVERPRGGGPLKTVIDHAPPAMRFKAPAVLQTVSGEGLRPIITDRAGRGVLVQVGNAPFYVLADPDLIANQGIGDIRQAGAALAMLDHLNSTGAKSVTFDVTLNGLGHSPSPLKLALGPPFLAVTAAIAAAVLLAGLRAIAPFGAPRRPERAIAFGKAALIDNTAALVRKARRETALGRRYADMVRERAAAVLGIPARLRDGALDQELDRRSGHRRFSDLAAAAADASGREDLLAAAQGLHQWQRENAA